MIKRCLKISLPILIVFALVISGYFYWHHQQLFPNTDDAYIQANIVDIAPRVDGKVIAVYVHDHQHVQKGQVLFDIDPQPYEIAVEKAQAELDNTGEDIAAANMAIQTAKATIMQRQAELIDIRSETRRTLALVKRKYASQAEGDLAIKNLHVAEAGLTAANSQLQEAIRKRGKLGANNAQLRAAQASLSQAQLNLQYTHVVAPTSGYIGNFGLRQGATVTAYNQLFALIEDHSLWAEANFKETQLNRIQPGQLATIKIDMYGNRVFHGIVTSISDDSGTSFSLLPAENASGNWVKVTQRFPVKVSILQTDSRYPLRLGASCSVTIDTTHPIP
jgi:membrane fusion protein (multidrug efflux system)